VYRLDGARYGNNKGGLIVDWGDWSGNPWSEILSGAVASDDGSQFFLKLLSFTNRAGWRGNESKIVALFIIDQTQLHADLGSALFATK
jgi:hypothetical protein